MEVPFQYQKGSMTFIHMTNFRMNVQCRKQFPSRYAQKNLLFDAHFRSAAIEFTGYFPMLRQIHYVVTVEKIQFYPSYLHLPGAKPNGMTCQQNFQSQPLAVG